MKLLNEINNSIGVKFNRLTLIRFLKIKNHRKVCLFKCECGTKKEFSFTRVKNGEVKSCGCISKEQISIAGKKYWEKQKIKNDSKLKKHIGKKYERWTVLKDDFNKKRNSFVCRCDCGTIRSIPIQRLLGGGSKSCGCLARELTSEKMKTHGMTKQRLHRIWSGMKTRCFNSKSISFLRYGAKGITVCNRWLKFDNFKKDMHESYLKHCSDHGEENTSIERKDIKKGYEPSNCRWATPKEQGMNRRIKLRKNIKAWELNAYKTLNKEFNIPMEKIFKIFRIKR